MSIYDNTITPTYLYIKQHSVTGLKYFGKTTSQDPIKYKGSGSYWIKHITTHGKEFVETIWLSSLFTDKTTLTEFALTFSKDNNIVESKEWANLILENGLDGSPAGIIPWHKGKRGVYSTEHRQKISAANSRRTLSAETKQKIRISKLNISDETRAKIGAASKNRKVTEETRMKLAAASTGKTHSDETKEKLRLINIGRKHTAETKEKLTGRLISNETRLKQSQTRKNYQK
jgi:NUMOD3 motif